MTVVVYTAACTHHSKLADVQRSGYPIEVSNIIMGKCAVNGCHNTQSYVNAGNLDLTTWDGLFKGTGTGSVVIPYRPDFSPLCYFTNTDTALGVAIQPVMPLNAPPLSREEYTTLRDWISKGAPGANGEVRFAGAQQKYYVTNRLCNVVTVIDAATRLQMRYIDVGGSASVRFPYCVRVAPDKQHWYVSFYAQSGYVQRFTANDDKPAGELYLGPGIWTSFAISANSRYGWFVDNSSPGKIAYADLQQMKLLATCTFGGNFNYPVGIALNEQRKELYAGAASGNFVYRIDIADPVNPVVTELPIDGSSTVQHQSSLDAIELLADKTAGKCYVACTKGEVRVLDMAKDSLLAVIPLGATPAFMTLSERSGKLFLSCPDDVLSFPGNRGAVAVIDIATNSVLKRINTGYQPYGLAVDEERGIVVVVNANISSAGPASHHVSGCGRKNGNVTFVDLSTLELVPGKKLELAVFPFGAAVR